MGTGTKICGFPSATDKYLLVLETEDFSDQLFIFYFNLI
jgi:hypothetical protein